MSVKALPDGYSTITPYLIVQGATLAIGFYELVFGAKERMRLAMPGDKIGHAELEIGNSLIMLADEPTGSECSSKSPVTVGGTPVTIHIYVEDVDTVFAKALAAGAKEIRAVADQFYGDRSGMFSDPFGHHWNVATHVEDVSPEEIQKRVAAMSKKD